MHLSREGTQCLKTGTFLCTHPRQPAGNSWEGFGVAGRTLVALGWGFWMVLASLNQFWPVAASSGWFQPVSSSSGQFQQVPSRSSWFQLVSPGSGWFLPGLAGSGRSQLVAAGSSQFWPVPASLSQFQLARQAKWLWAGCDLVISRFSISTECPSHTQCL